MLIDCVDDCFTEVGQHFVWREDFTDLASAAGSVFNLREHAVMQVLAGITDMVIYPPLIWIVQLISGCLLVTSLQRTATSKLYAKHVNPSLGLIWGLLLNLTVMRGERFGFGNNLNSAWLKRDRSCNPPIGFFTSTFCLLPPSLCCHDAATRSSRAQKSSN